MPLKILLPTQEVEKTQREGTLFALGAYSLWGLFPIYWKWLSAFSAFEILAHRVFWSFLFYWTYSVIKKSQTFAWATLLRHDSSQRNPIVLASCLLTFNWCLYIWAVNSGHVLESSLGYFITPLFNVLTGRLILKEQLSLNRRIAIAFAAVGVLILTIQTGRPPWISLGLALSFSAYGFIRKRLDANVLEASTAETSVMVPIALAVIIYSSRGGIPAEPHHHFLFVASGLVTGLPLIWFANAARRLPLSSLGFFQYIAPSIQFALGVFLYREPFTLAKLWAFGFIWTALAIFSWETLRKKKSESKPNAL